MFNVLGRERGTLENAQLVAVPLSRLFVLKLRGALSHEGPHEGRGHKYQRRSL
jgi:hypothetical protein